MIRKVLSIILNIIAGFFFYGLSLLGFTNEPLTGVKWGIMIGFSVMAVVALCGALALTRFRNWRRDTGIVLLSASGFTVFLIFTFICLLMTEEFRKMMRPDTLAFFSDYLTGGAIIVGFAGLGCVLLKTNKGSAEQRARADGDDSAAQP